MPGHLGDVLLRYDFARENLAAVDAHIQGARLDAHVKAAITLTAAQHHQLADLLQEQSELSEKFAQAADALSTAVRVAAEDQESA
jgi:Zn-dependent oligopeptidase